MKFWLAVEAVVIAVGSVALYLIRPTSPVPAKEYVFHAPGWVLFIQQVFEWGTFAILLFEILVIVYWWQRWIRGKSPWFTFST